MAYYSPIGTLTAVKDDFHQVKDGFKNYGRQSIVLKHLMMFEFVIFVYLFYSKNNKSITSENTTRSNFLYNNNMGTFTAIMACRLKIIITFSQFHFIVNINYGIVCYLSCFHDYHEY